MQQSSCALFKLNIGPSLEIFLLFGLYFPFEYIYITIVTNFTKNNKFQMEKAWLLMELQICKNFWKIFVLN